MAGFCGSAARERAAAFFSRDRLVDETLAFYRAGETAR